MKLSIVTPSWNSEETIVDTMRSVDMQTYSKIEHIVIDGASTDSTVKVISDFGSERVKIVSEKDNGIYDAMNKGIRMATGDIVGILNSDDMFYNDYTLELVVHAFQSQKVDCVFGDIIYVQHIDTNKTIRYWRSSPYTHGAFYKGWHPPHPAFFVRKEVYEKYGVFRENFDISADFELMLRFLEKEEVSSFYLGETLVRMRMGGESNRSIRNIVKGNINCLKAFKVNNLRVPLFYPIIRLLPKVKQYFNR